MIIQNMETSNESGRLVYNQAKTNEEAKNEKYTNFMTWLTQNGAIFPKMQYPAVFSSPDGGVNLNGVLAL